MVLIWCWMSALENIVDEQKETKYLLEYKYNTMSCWFIVIYGCTFIYIRNILFVAFVMRRSVVRLHFPANPFSSVVMLSDD
jgi:hypothetical protein